LRRAALSKDQATHILMWMAQITQTLRHPTGCMSEGWSSTAGEVYAAMSSQVVPQQACCTSVPSEELQHANVCCSFPEIVFHAVKSLLIPHIFHGRFWA
jgi:hypothetical protein